MKTLSLLIPAALVPLAASAEDQKPPLDPPEVVKQLYQMSSRSYGGAASYEVWGDGSIHFFVSVPGPRDSDTRLHGQGSTPEQALGDLKRKSEFVANSLVPEAEAKRASVLSVIESLKAMILGERKSQ